MKCWIDIFNLINNRNISSLMFCSSIDGEGVSTVTTHFAEYYASLNKNILLIKFSKPTDQEMEKWHSNAQFQRKIILANQAFTLQFQTVNDTFHTLYIEHQSHDTELINTLKISVNQKQLFAELQTFYELVVVEGTAISMEKNQDNSYENLASNCSATILITLLRSTPQQNVSTTIERLVHMGANVIGVIANELKAPPLGSEIHRQLDQIRKLLPDKLYNKLSKKLKSSPFLNTNY